MDKRKHAESAHPLLERRLAERIHCVGDRDGSRLGRDHTGAEGEGQQIPHGDRPCCRDRAFQRPAGIAEHPHVRQLRQEVVNRIIQAESAILDKRHRTRGDDRLRHRGHATDRVACHRRPRACALERESARRLDVHLAVAGQDGYRTRNEAGVDVTLEELSHPS